MTYSEIRRRRRAGSGSKKPWLIAMTVPLLALAFTGLIYLWSPWENFKRRAQARAQSQPADLLVRARTDQAPVLDRTDEPAKLIESPLALQVASFRTRTRAGQVLDEAMRRTGLRGVVLPTTVDGEEWHRIILGAFATEEEAREAAAPLLADGMITEVLVNPIPARWRGELTGSQKE